MSLCLLETIIESKSNYSQRHTQYLDKKMSFFNSHMKKIRWKMSFYSNIISFYLNFVCKHIVCDVGLKCKSEIDKAYNHNPLNNTT